MTRQPITKIYTLICCVNGVFYCYTGSHGIFSEDRNEAKIYTNLRNMKNAIRAGADYKNPKIWKTTLGGMDITLFKALVIAHVEPNPCEVEELLDK